jgi:hypothetical protein
MIISDLSPFRSLNFSSRSLFFAVLFGFALVSAGCKDFVGKKDVTNDSAYGNFSSVVGTWKSKIPLWLIEDDKTLYLKTANTLIDKTSRVLVAVPVGTDIRIERLIHEQTTETDLFHEIGTLTSGPYAGRTIELDYRIFSPNYFQSAHPGTTTRPGALPHSWTVATDILER